MNEALFESKLHVLVKTIEVNISTTFERYNNDEIDFSDPNQLESLEISVQEFSKQINLFFENNKLSFDQKIKTLEKLVEVLEIYYKELDSVLNKDKSEDYYSKYRAATILNTLQSCIHYSIIEQSELYELEYNSIHEYTKDSVIKDNNEIIEPIEETIELVKLTNREKKSKIQLNTEINNIAYLFYQLRENKIIESPYLGMALSKIFLNEKGEQIQNDLFNTYFKKFADNENPSKASIIDSFVKDFKKV